MIEVEVEDAAWTTALPDAEAVAARTAEAALSSPPVRRRGQGEGGGGATMADVPLAPLPLCPSPQEPALGRAARAARPEGGGDLTILLTDDGTVEDLNARFRGKDAPTNVLSFPAPATAAPHLGDIVLAYGVCAQEAAAQGKPLACHLMHLTAHGVLHLLGYDHETDADAEVMEGLERSILAGLGVADPYADPCADDHAL